MRESKSELTGRLRREGWFEAFKMPWNDWDYCCGLAYRPNEETLRE